MNELENQTETADRQSMSDGVWLVACSIITAIAAFVRFFLLELKPLHHDEGVNGFFLTTLFREGTYKYDPQNYHGPDLYYIALAFTKIFGLNTLSIRASVAIFGVLTVLLAFGLKNYIGKTGALAAALFLALSPGMVYISRYFIHEILFVFFSLGIVLAVLYFVEKRKAGVAATAAMTFLLLVCFLPTALNLANQIGAENETLVWILRVGLFAVEAVLVFLIMRMLISWRGGTPVYLLLASASAVMLFATKETAFVTVGTMAIACVCVWLWRKIYRALFGEIKENEIESTELTWENFRSRLGAESNSGFFVVQSGVASIVVFLVWLVVRVALVETPKTDKGVLPATATATVWNNVDYAVLAIALLLLLVSIAVRFYDKSKKISADFLLLSVAFAVVFLYVGALFFSSFFTYPEGISKAFEAYALWTKTGTKDHTQNGFLAYVKWGMKLESPILILSAIGTLMALLKARHRFAIFAGFWAFGLFAAYTIIPYKTPWLALSFLLPMCVVAGYGVGELMASRDRIVKFLGALVLIFAAATLAYQTYDLNFKRYDDDSMPYVYAHTTRGFLDLIKQIERYAEKSGKGKDASVEIVSPDYWSMPWYLREYPKAVFHGQFFDANASEMIVASTAQKGELNQRYGAHYKYAGTYPLRPGVDLILLVRKNLADSGAQDLYYIGETAP